MKKSHSLIFMTLILLATIITYANHFGNSFQFDDSHTVTENTYIRDIHNIPLFFKDGTTSSILPLNQAYRPLVVTSLSIDYWLGNGYNLFYFHLSTFIFFLLQGILMWLLFRSLLKKQTSTTAAAYGALMAVAVYLLHPAMAETVNYISARSDVQSTFFVILAFVLYIYSAICRKYFLYLIPVCIGCLAKPTAVMFAPMFFCYVVLFENNFGFNTLFKKNNHRLYWQAIKQSLPAFAVCIFMYVFVDKMTPETWIPGGTSATKYLVTQPYVILHYFTTFFAPTSLSADADWKVLSSIWDIRFFAGLLFIALLLLVIIHTSKKTSLRPISFGICWFLLALIPSSSIIPLAEVMNDHRMYFPFVGLAISIIWSMALLLKAILPGLQKNIPAYRPILVITVVLILSVFAYGTSERNKVWHTPESLWKDVTIKSPNNPRGQMNYGLTLMAKGKYKEAIRYYQVTLDQTPDYPYAYINMGIAKANIGSTAEAEDMFKQAIAYGSDLPDPYCYYAEFLMNMGRNEEAKTYLDKGLQISPKYFRLLNMKTQNDQVLSNRPTTGNNTLQDLLDKIKSTPTPENYLTLSLEYYNLGRYEDCIAAARQSLQLRPSYDLAYNNICAAYNMLRQWDRAIEAGEKGLSFNPNNQLLKNNLAESKKNKAAGIK